MDADHKSPPSRLDEAMTHHRAGALDAAAAGYGAVLTQDPSNFDALHLLGVINLQGGDAHRAIELLERALAVHPEAYPAVHQLGSALLVAGRIDDAARQFERAVALAPDYVPSHEALGNLRHGQRRVAEAVREFEIVARLRPNAASAHINLGTALGQLDRFDDALASYRLALAIAPLDAIALLNTANLLSRMSRAEEATEYFRAVLAQRPMKADVYYRAGFHFYAQGHRDEARAAYEAALRLDPLHVLARWAMVISEIPLAYGPGEDPEMFRERFAEALEGLDAWFDADRAPLGHHAVGGQHPFYLAYHEVDNLPLLSRYGDLCARLMKAWHPAPFLRAARAGRSGRPRVAIASKYFVDHSVWTALLAGWCTQLDRQRIDLHLLHTGSGADEETARCHSFTARRQQGLVEPEQWIDAIDKLRPDVILYPEIGMDAMCAKLASLRLAPVQITSWGQPMTSGLPDIDYYLSAELFEPPDAAGHYREKLVRLPNLSCYYEALNPHDAQPRWEALDVDHTIPCLVCAGTPYKYFPQHDHVLVEIAQRLGRCQFLFFIDMAPHLSRQIEERLHLAFRRSGLDPASFIKFLPRQVRPAFFGLMRTCDVYLDTIGFSGFNTVIQAVECDLPVVTLEGRYLRGRLGAGVLRRMGMDELVVRDASEYVETALRLCQDVGYGNDVRRRMTAQRGVLFRDLAPVRALEEFLIDVAGQS